MADIPEINIQHCVNGAVRIQKGNLTQFWNVVETEKDGKLLVVNFQRRHSEKGEWDRFQTWWGSEKDLDEIIKNLRLLKSKFMESKEAP